MEKKGYTISDREVGETLTRLAARSTGRIIVGLFASSIPRIQQAVNTASEMGRRVVFNGRSLETSVRIARSLGYIDIPEGMEDRRVGGQRLF